LNANLEHSDVTLIQSSKRSGVTPSIETPLSKHDSEFGNGGPDSSDTKSFTPSDDFELVIKFINMLMSDTTFHLDESLTGLAKINSIRSEMEDRATWEAKPEAERKELESQLSSAESNTPFHTTKEPFLTGEIVGRLAAVSS
jgi:hypothetical protein